MNPLPIRDRRPQLWFESRSAPALSARAWSWLTADTYALPLDVFRILAGIVCFASFVRDLSEVRDFTGPGGFVDHGVVLSIVSDIDPFARIGALGAGSSAAWCYLIYAIGAISAVGVTLGVWTRACAIAMWFVGVSAYRFNYVVSNVDDYGLNLVVFWLILLPLGHTLSVPTFARQGARAFERWVGVRVPGLTVRMFLLNVALIYLVAGLLKWGSPYWRDGFALFAVSRMSIARFPELFGSNGFLLVAGTYVTLLLEPAVPFLMCLGRGHRIKQAGIALLVGLHLGITLMLMIPFVNLALAAASILVLREDIMQRVLQRFPRGEQDPTTPRPHSRSAAWGQRLCALGAIATIVLLLIRLAPADVAIPDGARLSAFRSLQALGIAGGYSLFDWVDQRGIHRDLEIRSTRPSSDDRSTLTRANELGITEGDLWPGSMRAQLMLSYLAGEDWMATRLDKRSALQEAFRTRIASRFCAKHPEPAWVEAYAHLEQTAPVERPPARWGVRLIRFGCSADGRATVLAGSDPNGRRERQLADWVRSRRESSSRRSRTFTTE